MKHFLSIYIYIIMIMITKWKSDFFFFFKKRRDLQRIKPPRITVVRFFVPPPWCRIMVRHEALITRYSDLALDFSWNWNVSLICWVQTRWEETFELNAQKGGRQELLHSRRIIYHRGRDENDRLAYQDVCDILNFQNKN